MRGKRPTCEETTTRAYQIYLESGRRLGHDFDDWLQAEYELMKVPVGELAKLTVLKTSKARREVKSIIDVTQAAIL